MLQIEKKITHIINPSSSLLILSDHCMEDNDEMIEKMLEQKGAKIFTSTKKKKAYFQDQSQAASMIQEYKDRNITFEEWSCRIAQRIFEGKMKAGLYEDFDLVVMEGLYEERRYIIVLENSYHEGITHHVSQSDDEIENKIITTKTMLSASLMKQDAAFCVELSDLSVSIIEPSVEIEGEACGFYSKYVLGCDTQISYAEGTKALTKTCRDIASRYEMDEVKILPKMKKLVSEHVEAKSDINLNEIADILFDDLPLAKQEFKEDLKRKGWTQSLETEHVKATKTEKVQKIRTDHGIEIIIPIDYMNSRDYIEFSNAPDGTISIRLKNINKLISK